MIAPGLVLSLSDGAELISGKAGPRVRVRGASLDFSAQPPAIQRAVARLRVGAHDGDLAAIGGGTDGATLAQWYLCRTMLEQHGGITHSVKSRSVAIACGVALSPWFRPSAEPPETWMGPTQLSRFAYVHRGAKHLVLESPITCARVELCHRYALASLSLLARPATASLLVREIRGLSVSTARQLLALLGYFGMLTRVGEDGRTAEDENSALRTWHFADLLFHSRSRMGRHDERGETFRYLRTLEPLPVFKQPMSTRTIPLHKPDLRALAGRGRSLTHVLEERRSIRDYGHAAVTIRQLGEFLYRTARVKEIIPADGDRLPHDVSRRPHPGGGACYELELYLAVQRCHGLARGLYHYDPMHHRLEVLNADPGDLAALIKEARSPAARGGRQVVIVMAARFQRMSWKYSASTYAPILKNVGVLLQTMYLVASEMKLAPCAIGGGNSDRFAAMAGTQYFEETSVGEFLLGSRPSGWRPERPTRLRRPRALPIR